MYSTDLFKIPLSFVTGFGQGVWLFFFPVFPQQLAEGFMLLLTLGFVYRVALNVFFYFYLKLFRFFCFRNIEING